MSVGAFVIGLSQISSLFSWYAPIKQTEISDDLIWRAIGKRIRTNRSGVIGRVFTLPLEYKKAASSVQISVRPDNSSRVVFTSIGRCLQDKKEGGKAQGWHGRLYQSERNRKPLNGQNAFWRAASYCPKQSQSASHQPQSPTSPWSPTPSLCQHQEDADSDISGNGEDRDTTLQPDTSAWSYYNIETKKKKISIYYNN